MAPHFKSRGVSIRPSRPFSGGRGSPRGGIGSSRSPFHPKSIQRESYHHHSSIEHRVGGGRRGSGSGGSPLSYPSSSSNISSSHSRHHHHHHSSFTQDRSFTKVTLICPHCKFKCERFFQYNEHFEFSSHMKAMKDLCAVHSKSLTKLRSIQSKINEEVDQFWLDHVKGESEAKPVSSLYCPECKVDFNTSRSFHINLEVHKTIENLLKPKCIPCKQSFSSPLAYEEHVMDIEHMKTKLRKGIPHDSVEDNLSLYVEKYVKMAEKDVESGNIPPGFKKPKPPAPVEPTVDEDIDGFEMSDLLTLDEVTTTDPTEVKSSTKKRGAPLTSTLLNGDKAGNEGGESSSISEEKKPKLISPEVDQFEEVQLKFDDQKEGDFDGDVANNDSKSNTDEIMINDEICGGEKETAVKMKMFEEGAKISEAKKRAVGHGFVKKRTLHYCEVCDVYMKEPMNSATSSTSGSSRRVTAIRVKLSLANMIVMHCSKQSHIDNVKAIKEQHSPPKKKKVSASTDATSNQSSNGANSSTNIVHTDDNVNPEKDTSSTTPLSESKMDETNTKNKTLSVSVEETIDFIPPTTTLTVVDEDMSPVVVEPTFDEQNAVVVDEQVDIEMSKTDENNTAADDNKTDGVVKDGQKQEEVEAVNPTHEVNISDIKKDNCEPNNKEEGAEKEEKTDDSLSTVEEKEAVPNTKPVLAVTVSQNDS